MKSLAQPIFTVAYFLFKLSLRWELESNTHCDRNMPNLTTINKIVNKISGKGSVEYISDELIKWICFANAGMLNPGNI